MKSCAPCRVVRMRISGNTLLSILEMGVTGYPSDGKFLQVGNIQYSFMALSSFSSSTGYDSKLVNARLLNGSMVYGVGGADANVTIVTNNYMATGGDG